MVSLFLSTALVLSTVGCSTQQKVVYDKDGNPIVQQDNRNPGFFSGFFGPFGPLGPFGFFSGRSSGYNSGTVRSPGVSSGTTVTPVTPVTPGTSQDLDPNNSTPKSNTGVTGVSPWGRSGSTNSSPGSSLSPGSNSSSGSTSSGGTGITSGSHGGIGGGGSSAS